MPQEISLQDIYKPSDDVVAREIEGEFLLIPIAKGIGDMEDELYSLNESGKAIWDRLDGVKTLAEIKEELLRDFDAPAEQIEKDIVSFVRELVIRNILVAV